MINNPQPYDELSLDVDRDYPRPIRKVPIERKPKTTYRYMNPPDSMPQWQMNLMWFLIGLGLILITSSLGLSIFNTTEAVNKHNLVTLNNITTNATELIYHNSTVNITTNTYVNSTFNGTYVKAIVPGSFNVVVNNSDPFFPSISFFCNDTGVVQTIINGTGILVDNSIPKNPVVSTTAVLTMTPGTPDVTIDNTDPQNLILSVNTTIAGPCIESVTGSTGITIDNSDPANIIVSTTAVLSVEPGNEIYINNTDPQNPIISANITIPICVESVNSGLGISVDNTDPLNPIVNNAGVIQAFGSQNIIVDNTDPQNPIISTNVSLNVIQQTLQDNGSYGDPFLLSTQSGTLGLYKNQGAALHSRLVILVQSGVIGNTVIAQTNGVINDMTGLISGAFYYYDTSTNVLTNTPTTYFVGYALSSSSLFFSPQPIYIP